ncbi:CHASE domain-containing protein [Roseateles oligotrophus]|uniref:histidine kinase n=1 Tax=Roseateles oligotrophus TaxID=1769250 RepID=A0ABT2YHX4_9BURK|nr:CHASE domain-containing protein [Roseateles oligotrophus]MCV2369663.1 CHASE domain-containing protein [Roseateles oligotrophus]
MKNSAIAKTASRGQTLRPGLLDVLLIGTIALAGSAISYLGYQSLRKAEALRREEIFSATVETVLSSVELELTRAVEVARNGGLMLELQPQLQRKDFNHYAQGLTRQLPSVQVLEWQPVVMGAERTQFEASARAQGLQDYRIVEPDEKTGAWLTAPARDDYVPVLYAWPEKGAALGFNLGADPLRMASKLKAASLAEPVASESFRILRGDIQASASFGFAITAAVLGEPDGTGSVKARAYLAVVIELPLLLQHAAGHANDGHLDLLVYDQAMSLSKPIYTGIGPDSDLRALTADGSVAELAAQAGDRIKSLAVAGRKWQVVLHPRPAYFAALPKAHANWVLGAGLLCTLLLMFAARHLQRGRRSLLLAQHNLLDERQRLQNVIEGTGAGSWEYNFETDEMRVNERWAEIGGLDPKAYAVKTGYDWQTDCHPDDVAMLKQTLLKHLSGERANYQVEFRRRHVDGRWIWVSARGKVLRRDARGRALTIACTMVEIGERKEAEARVLELNSTLEQRVAQRGAELEEAMLKLRQSQEELTRSQARATLNTLAAGVSHELSTPMSNSLISANTVAALAKEFAQAMAAGGLKRIELERFVGRVSEGSELVVRNLERALDLMQSFRQVATDQASEQRRRFDLRTSVQELLEALAPSLSLQPHRIDLNIPNGIELDSYPGPLGQVLTNLINNAYLHAFDGMEQGGVLKISAEAAGPNHVRISCRDNGRGMDAATLEKLFIPFFSTKIGKGGSGLGMSIIDNLVNKTLGGSLQVESAPGEGTSVHVTLPLMAPQVRD